MQGHEDEAYTLLQPYKAKLSPDAQLLLHELTYKKGLWREAIEIGNRVYQHHPTYPVALRNALCHAHLKEVRATVGWLQCAVKNGLPDLPTTLNQSDFNEIRRDPLFMALQAQRSPPLTS
jgi:hypothetical protein